MTQHHRSLSCFLTVALLATCSTAAMARTSHKAHPAKNAHDKPHAKSHEASGKRSHHAAARKKLRHAKLGTKHGAKHLAKAHRKSTKLSHASHKNAPKAEPAPPLSGDLALVKDAIGLARKGKTSDATAVQNTIGDPAAKKLVEWFMLRHSESTAKFSRYATFIADNPGWPSMAQLRRRAEGRLWEERSDAATVRGFVGDQPLSAKGKFALARVLLAEGDREGAARLVREAWRSDELSERSEADALEAFRDLLTREDHRARMDKRIGAKDLAGARRAAQRLGSEELAIVKACAAGTADKALDKLNAVASDARSRSRLHAVPPQMAGPTRPDRRRRPPGAGGGAGDHGAAGHRRMVARAAQPRPQAARPQQVRRPPMMSCAARRCRRATITAPISISCAAGSRCATATIPATARTHFAHIDEGSANPIVLARAHYWRGRVAEAIGEQDAMRKSYEAAARYPTAYYGQLARASLGLDRIELRAPAQNLCR